MHIVIFIDEISVAGIGFKIMWMGGGYKWNKTGHELIIDETR